MDKYVTHKELEANTKKVLHQMDKHFADIQQQMDKRFADAQQRMDKRFNAIELELHDTKNIAKTADWKLNWILGILSASIVGVVVATFSIIFHQ